MGALRWEIHKADSFVVVTGIGVFDLPFIIRYRKAVNAEGAADYRKLLDLHRTEIALSPGDLDTIADDARFNRLTTGPVAIMIGKNPPLMLLDMAVLLQQRMGSSRRTRLFSDEGEARRWLASEPIFMPSPDISPS